MRTEIDWRAGVGWGEDVVVAVSTARIGGSSFALDFQVRALDYILKPFDRERFTDALQRARRQIEREETGDLGRRLLALVKDLRRDQHDRLPAAATRRPEETPSRHHPRPHHSRLGAEGDSRGRPPQDN